MMKSRKGFTLIELLIVVVIIGILAAIAIPKFSNTKEKAYVAAMKADLRNLVTAEEAYFSDNAVYTTTLTADQYRTSTGVTNLTIAVGTGYFIATVDHTATGVSCTIEVGTGTRDGEPVCN
ncbi:prepilin-type N-terminal cleavage/methylation domain-containing protein [Pseudogemmatithrix spongiicola]|uniref:Prepilin-type N-terminal cleavage/methylation domain-containing protein n=1 Tax=Pseudogemmatithrix spongiicola TaxID=3062599 RepID=A0AA49K1W1_9BACT|nr:prepilin-type N-terminal cleavage/methylation domain-containing protein [Gemmatimonadaceae bacterium 'strain 138']WKW15950.1 prepilin-type N-terminal cleavage/methylation domain-containing protein [Gemmatimonadaceae bacterium 'strain 318']